MVKRVLASVWNVVCYFLGLSFNAMIILVSLYLIYTYALKSFDTGKEVAIQSTQNRAYKEASITVANGATVYEVAQQLQEAGIIGNALYFRFENVLKGSDDPYPGGTFVVNSNMDSNGLNATLRNVIVRGEDIKITIKEGYSIRDIAKYLEANDVLKEQEFIDACNEGDFQYGFLEGIPKRENRLEGFLFPDTYFIAKDSSAEAIIHKFLTRFEEVYTPEMQEKAALVGLSTDQVVTIASIIEKEVNREEERKVVSSVIYNRLAGNIKLEMCSTILYVLDKRKDRLLFEDLEVESPYNTYIHGGLPVGPISNPGLACIEAALDPEETNYLYFVVKDEETGQHFFTDNYNQFLDAKEEYQQKF